MSLYDDAVLVQIPSGYGEGVLYGQKPNTTAGDFTVTRDSLSTRVNESLLFEPLLPDTPLIDYLGGGCPKLKLFPQRTRLNEHPDDLTDAYWTKSGATIDPTAVDSPMLTPKVGSELVTNGDMELDANWVNFGTPTTNERSSEQAYAGTYSRKFIGDSGGDGIQQTGITTVVGGVYLVEAYCYLSASTAISIKCELQTSGGSADGTTNVITTTGSWQLMTAYVTATTTSSKIAFYQSGAGATTVYIDNVSVKEISNGSSGEQWKAAWLMTATSANGYIELTTPLTISNTTDYANSIYIKRVTGTGDILIKDVNNAETVVSDGEALADSWYKYDVVSESTSTSGQLGLKLATSGDEVLVFFPQNEAGSYSTYPIWSGVSAGTETREADAVTDGGDATTFASVNSSGCLYINTAAFVNDGDYRQITLSDGTTNNRVALRYTDAINQISALVVSGGVNQCNILYTLTDATDFNKIAFNYSEDDFSLYVNGVEVGTDTSGDTFSASTLTDLSFHNPSGSSEKLFIELKELGIYNTLTPTERANLTTP